MGAADGGNVAFDDKATGSAVQVVESDRKCADRIGMARDHRQPMSIVAQGVRHTMSAPVHKPDALLLLATITSAIATLEAMRLELSIEVASADEPSDDEWAQYEEMRAAEEITPRRERFDDEIADRLDAINDAHFAQWEATR